MWKGRFLLFHKELFPALLLSSLNSILSYSFKPHFPLTISLTGPFLFVAVICCSYFLRPPSCCHSRSILSSTYSSLCLLPQSLYSISPSHFSIFPFSLVNPFTTFLFFFFRVQVEELWWLYRSLNLMSTLMGPSTMWPKYPRSLFFILASPLLAFDQSLYLSISLYFHPSLSLSLSLSTSSFLLWFNKKTAKI